MGVAVNTVKNWISILEAGLQIVLVKPFYRNQGKRLVKSPKVYFLDTGFLCYLNGLATKEQVFKGPSSGALLETVVLGELIRDFYNRGEIPQIYWWRTSYGEEGDFVIERNGKLIPLEIKLGAKQTDEMVRGLTSFVRLFSEKIDAAYLVNLSEKKIMLREKIGTFPYLELVKKSILA